MWGEMKDMLIFMIVNQLYMLKLKQVCKESVEGLETNMIRNKSHFYQAHMY